MMAETDRQAYPIHPWTLPVARKAVGGDAVLAAGSYLLAYVLRFPGPERHAFLAGALRTLPLVAACQVAGLAALGAYRRPVPANWPWRVGFGAAGGTLAGASMVAWLWGLTGVSRIAFAVNLVLLILGSLGWRGVRLIAVLSRSGPALGAEMVDRSEEMASVPAMFLAVFRYRELVRNLVLKDLKLKYRGSVVGFLWSLLNPLLNLAVYTIAFTYILHNTTERYVFFLLLGILPWTFFVNALMMSTGSIVDGGSLIRSVAFPRAILPMATVLFNFVQFALSVLVLLPLIMIFYRITPTASMLLFPLFLALQLLFTFGLAMLIATGTAFFRDIKHLLEVALAMLFWLTPIVYQLQIVPDSLRLPLLLSPMTSFVMAYRQLFYDRSWPSAEVWLITVTYSVAAAIVGTATFLSFQQRLAEEV